MNRSRITHSRELWAILLVLAMVFAFFAFAGAGIWFALPREPVISAGHMDDYSWSQPEYVPVQSATGIFLHLNGNEMVALDATSTTSGCRIRWISSENKFIDPCCGMEWNRNGAPTRLSLRTYQPMTRYKVEITMGGEIIVYPWRIKGANESGTC